MISTAQRKRPKLAPSTNVDKTTPRSISKNNSSVIIDLTLDSDTSPVCTVNSKTENSNKRKKGNQAKQFEREKSFLDRSRYPPKYYSRGKDNYDNDSDVSTTSSTNRQQKHYDEKDGHYVIKLDSDLTSRYTIVKLLGQGTFGKVVECYDRLSRNYKAIKIIRSVQKYREAAKVEIQILNELKKHDPNNVNRCIHLIECFDYRHHICMVFEKLSISMFDFMKANDFKPFPLRHIREFAKQILNSVKFIHDLNLIHTDLKPENLMLVDSKTSLSKTRSRSRKGNELINTEIRLIDFGSAIFEEDYHSTIVSTRHYRAPEILLQTGWSFPCDLWSVGCILVEFCTGDALFQTHDNLEHLAMMQASLGRFPVEIIDELGSETQKYFYGNAVKYPIAETTSNSLKYVKAMKPISSMLNLQKDDSFHQHFVDLVKKLLQYDPKRRLTAREALNHPFFSSKYD
ncbi:dual specificity protein kinase kns1 [Clydaea vesicula]|uniref:Dual specificity protein kinase kns1 n=1 Tax=Clydaea vesicula TaxID=447962 RepID=A0AAD5U5Q8_9FUNG|nr:dual specificity protein kinase kns1 [Clydaea vesicula]